MNTIMRKIFLSVVITVFCFTSLLVAQAPARSKPPELGPTPAMKLPPIQHFTLSNGLKVMLMEKHELPLVQMELMWKVGEVLNPADQPGLASMTVDMMNEGAGKRNALELSDAINFLGAQIYATAGMHTSGVSMHTPLSKLDKALDLFADIIMKPTFPADELERKKTERLTTLMQWHDQARAIASVIYNRTLFGSSHPYGIPDMGNEASIRAMKVDDPKKFYAAYLHPGNATLIIVGDLKKDAIQKQLEKIFKGWKAHKPALAMVAAAPQITGRTVYVVDKPGSAQSVIRIGRIGVARTSEDYFAIQVMNTILGGSFSSRLNQNIREEHQYTYGAGSMFAFRPAPGAFTAYADVQTNVTDSSLIQFMYELGRISDITDDEVSRAKNYLALGYPDDFSTIASITGAMADLALYNLPDDYFNNYIQKILAVTKDDIVNAAKKYIDANNLAIVVVGDKAKIEQGITNLNLGKIVDYSIDDVLGKAPVVEGGK